VDSKPHLVPDGCFVPQHADGIVIDPDLKPAKVSAQNTGRLFPVHIFIPFFQFEKKA
jgi:hypothetical protein